MRELDKLFRFPIIMIDGDEEERRAGVDPALTDKEDPDIYYGEAEVPYDDFRSIKDMWIPVKESREKAAEGHFEACLVLFDISGPFIVPWTKAKFKKRLRDFAAEVPPEEPQFQVLSLDQFKDKYVKDEDSNAGEAEKG